MIYAYSHIIYIYIYSFVCSFLIPLIYGYGIYLVFSSNFYNPRDRQTNYIDFWGHINVRIATYIYICSYVTLVDREFQHTFLYWKHTEIDCEKGRGGGGGREDTRNIVCVHNESAISIKCMSLIIILFYLIQEYKYKRISVRHISKQRSNGQSRRRKEREEASQREIELGKK